MSDILKDGCCKSERTSEIKKLLCAVRYKTEQEYDSAVESFDRSNLTLEEIGRMAVSLATEPEKQSDRKVGVA